MDTISVALLRFQQLKDRANILQSEIAFKTAENKKLLLEVAFYKKDSTLQHQQRITLLEAIKKADEKNEAEVALYKSKSKNKFWAFLGGTAFGALILAVLNAI